MGRRASAHPAAFRHASVIVAIAVVGIVLVSACGPFGDDVPPGITLVGLTSGSVVDRPDIAVFVRVVDDRSSVAAVRIRTAGGVERACTLSADDLFACASVPLVVGDNLLTIAARDAAGNVAELHFVLRRPSPPDDSPPSIVLVEPDDGATVVGPSLTVTADVSDDRGVVDVTYATDHGASGPCAAAIANAWTCGPVPLPVGTTTISVTARDAAGNVAAAAVTVTREDAGPSPDVTPPKVTIVEPVSWTTVTASEIVMNVSVSDDRGVASVSFATDHGAGGACALAFGGGYACGPVPLPPGFTTITVTAEDAAGNEGSDAVTVQRVVPPAPAFDIEIVFFDESFSVSQRAAFVDAAARWEELVVGDLEDVAVDLPLSGSCGLGEPAYAGTIDDLVIFATSFTEGVGGLLGSAGPCLFRSSGVNPGTNLVGIMRFDTADLASLEAQGALVDVIVHEMGHVLGFGTNWEFPPYFDLLDYLPSGGGTSCRNASGFLRDPTYVGTSGVAGWSALGGSGAVPVEETGGPGTQCGHWDEQVFGSELMTGYLNIGGPNPLSAMTVRSLEDLGLTVDPSAADPYALPPEGALRVQGALNLMAAEELLFPRGSVDPASGQLDLLPRRPGSP